MCEAVRFAKSNNLLGIMVDAVILVSAPCLCYVEYDVLLRCTQHGQKLSRIGLACRTMYQT